MELVLVFLVGIIAGIMGILSGSGGLISIPFLIFLGYPAQIAIASNKFSLLGQSFGAIPKFAKSKTILWSYALPFSLMGVLGVFVGGTILLEVSEKVLLRIVSLILFLMLPVLLAKKELGLKRIEKSKACRAFGLFLYFFIGIYDGFFGGGAGMIYIYLVIQLFGFSMIDALATRTIPNLVTSSFLLTFFYINGIVDISLGVTLMLGGIFGAYIASHLAILKGNKWVKALFLIMVFVSAVKIFFF